MKHFEQSPETKDIFAALVKFQAMAIKIEKESQGQIGQKPYKYANLEDVFDAIREPLADLELAISQTVGEMTAVPYLKESGVDDKGNPFTYEKHLRLQAITTQLIHSSGQWIRETASIPSGDHAGISIEQSSGRSIAYGRRYSILSILGISTTDDDAKGESEPESPRQRYNPRQQGPPAKKALPAATAPDKINTETRTWQELYKSGDWKGVESPQNPADLLGDLKWGEISPIIASNAKSGFSPNVTAASADWLFRLCNESREMTVEDALKKVGWTGPEFFSMGAKDILLAYTAVAKNIPKPTPA